jgi:hypothetical protein
MDDFNELYDQVKKATTESKPATTQPKAQDVAPKQTPKKATNIIKDVLIFNSKDGKTRTKPK